MLNYIQVLISVNTLLPRHQYTNSKWHKPVQPEKLETRAWKAYAVFVSIFWNSYTAGKHTSRRKDTAV